MKLEQIEAWKYNIVRLEPRQSETPRLNINHYPAIEAPVDCKFYNMDLKTILECFLKALFSCHQWTVRGFFSINKYSSPKMWDALFCVCFIPSGYFSWKNIQQSLEPMSQSPYPERIPSCFSHGTQYFGLRWFLLEPTWKYYEYLCSQSILNKVNLHNWSNSSLTVTAT